MSLYLIFKISRRRVQHPPRSRPLLTFLPSLTNQEYTSPTFYLEKLGKREEIPKKMRNFVGSFDCVDKLKYALRQPFEQ